MTSHAPTKKGWFSKFLRFVEWAGNLLPHPVALFAIFAAGVVILSFLCEQLGLQVPDPRPEGAKGRTMDGVILAKSLLSAEGIRWMVLSCVRNFTDFAPLGTVLVAMLGVGVAEKSGLLATVIRALVLKAPAHLITPVLVFAGVISNVASEMGYVVLVPMGGFIYLALGRHPLAGMAAVFAGVSGGYSSNLLISTVDPLLSGITQEAARLIAPEYSVHAAVNWYFMASSCMIVTILGWWISVKIVEPTLGAYEAGHGDFEDGAEKQYLEALTTKEKKGLLYSGLSLLVLTAITLVLLLPEGAVLRNPSDPTILKSAFLKGIVTFLFLFFLIPSTVYGYAVGAFKSVDDVIEGMSQAMRTLGLYIVLVFFAAQFIAYFKWTNLGFITAVKGADFLQSIGLTGIGVFIPFILMCALINLSLGSASAQWAVTAPVFVPMLMLLGYSPELIQAAYRIGDSTTNIITPMMSYFGLILAFAHRFDKRLGMGTIISTMLPYSIVFLIGWATWFYLWVFVFGLPVGPGAATYFTP
ncbi:AbgT family transporter [Pseudobacteriovorax antillogorgiicola]|uniref:Aminobenzoyl-glutamate transport protein n=1 Tax=Pseudobacteriovorax antillogorgiicola TaxID=1513793 RepID=A0A1Y6B9Z7_9BACT|nr:AbgT family transporter [Pseudobacteriovorax antillogorgiicola]TCS57457.1 aminobenzoyl-glutamate transport protein [Pseudobacteriovorax antillogorgiicola]SMF00822.1 aminobenzoyl-glutamate transport protein [Pseudobacteriovorax antillogorgiicola]